MCVGLLTRLKNILKVDKYLVSDKGKLLKNKIVVLTKNKCPNCGTPLKGNNPENTICSYCAGIGKPHWGWGG